MRTCTDTHLSSSSKSGRSAARERSGSRIARNGEDIVQLAGTKRDSPGTVFDLLYDQYLPFRLYADFMLGSSTAALADEFALSEDWVIERIKAIRWCIEKQVRVNLLDQQSGPRVLPLRATGPAA